MTRPHRPEIDRARPTPARLKLRRWSALVRETLFGEKPKPAERAEHERGEHSGAGFSYKARDGL
jgi:hypothetical protein